MTSVDEHIVQAASFHEQGDIDKAIGLLEAARALEPGRPEIHFNLGRYYGLLGNSARASEYFNEAVRCRPDWIDAHIYLIAYTVQAGENDLALELLDAAFKVAPDNKNLHEQFAIAMERKLALERASGTAVELEQALGYLQSAVGHIKTTTSASGMSGDPDRVRQHIEMLARVRGAVALAESSLAREQGMAFNRVRPAASEHDFPGFIILTTMPKSGSEYVWMALTTGLNLTPIRISSAEMFEVIDGERLEHVSKGGFVTHGHMRCTETNSVLLSQHVDRLVVHVRDPRQALVSWVHYQDHREIVDLPTLNAWGSLSDMTFEARVDYFIDGFFAHQVKFLKSWVDAESDKEFLPRILVTRQEDLRSDPDGFFLRILNFYDLNPELFRFPEPPKKGERHFRRGETDEWRRVLLPGQIERIQGMLSDQLLERFGWQR